MRRILSGATAVFIAATLAVSAAAQRRAATPSGTLAGVVLGPDGQPAAGVQVIQQASDGRQPHATRTDPRGRFRFRVRTGLYDLRAQAKGGASEWEHNVLVRPGQQASVTLHLAQNKLPASKPRVRPTKPAANPVKPEPR